MPTSELRRSNDSWVHLSAPPADAHGVQFYEEDAALCDSVAHYLAAGLEAGEPAIAIVTPAHEREIRARLDRFGFAGEHTTFLDAREAIAGFMIGPLPDAELFERTIGRVVAEHAARENRNVRAFGEMVDILWRDGNSRAAIRLEELWDDLASRHSFSLLCAYVMDDFLKEAGGESFRTICRHHPHVFRPDGQAWVEPRSGEVAELRERTGVLEAEIAHRKRLESALRDALGDLRRSEQALRESRQDLEDFVENAIEGLHWLGPDGTILWANKAEFDLLGYSKEEFIGRHVADFHADREVIEDMLERLGRNEELVDYEARLVARDGSIKHVLINSNARWEDGRFRHSRCFLRDVTDRRQLERDEFAARRAIEEAHGVLKASLGERDRLIDQLTSNVRFSEMFVGILGHDLRNPLMAIGTAASLLERRNDSGRCTKPIGRIQSSARRMSRMIDQILDFTRLRIGGGLPLQCRPLDLPTVCRGVLDELEMIDDGERIELEVTGDVHGTWDEDRLCQLVSNLAGNALQHRQPGSRVRVRVDGGDRAEVLIHFLNEGCIPAALLPTLFEPFHGRLELKAPRSSGLGLGLFISQQIARAHGGRIDVGSSMDEGTCFTVALPRHVEEGALLSAPERSSRP